MRPTCSHRWVWTPARSDWQPDNYVVDKTREGSKEMRLLSERKMTRRWYLQASNGDSSADRFRSLQNPMLFDIDRSSIGCIGPQGNIPSIGTGSNNSFFRKQKIFWTQKRKWRRRNTFHGTVSHGNQHFIIGIARFCIESQQQIVRGY